jgi:hypothetical protein
MPADQHSVHRINEANSESSPIQLSIVYSRSTGFAGLLRGYPRLSPAEYPHYGDSNSSAFNKSPNGSDVDGS